MKQIGKRPRLDRVERMLLVQALGQAVAKETERVLEQALELARVLVVGLAVVVAKERGQEQEKGRVPQQNLLTIANLLLSLLRLVLLLPKNQKSQQSQAGKRQNASKIVT
jgi:hypothetical protein